jgi:muramidase (phage lysozyme)
MAATPTPKPKAFRKLVRRNNHLIVIFVDGDGHEISDADLKNYDIGGTTANGDPGTSPLPTPTPTPDPTPTPADDHHAGPGSVGGTSYDPHVQPPAKGTAGKGLLELLGNESPIGKLAHSIIREPKGSGKDTTRIPQTGKPNSLEGQLPTDSSVPGIPQGKGYYGAITIDGSVDTKHVNPDLYKMLNEAALRSPYKVVITSGDRPGDPRFHGKGLAVDVQLYDPVTNKPLPNYQTAESFRAYEQYAQTVKNVQLATNPNYPLRWGGYFSGQTGKYGALDIMHFDGGGQWVGMAGGSWETGLYDGKNNAKGIDQKKFLPGAVSVGMGDLKNWKQLPPPGVSPIKELQEGEQSTQVAPTPMQRPADLSTQSGPSWKEMQDSIFGLKQQVGDTTPLTPPPNPLTNPGVQGKSPDDRSVAYTPASTINVSPDGTETPASQAGSVQMPPGARPSSIPEQTDSAFQLLGNSDFENNYANARPTTTLPAANPLQPATSPIGAPVKVVAVNPDGSVIDPDQAVKDSFLTQINKAEGAPAANTLFGNSTVSLTADHPNKKVFYNNGKDWSTAAGLYGITYPTWQEFSAKVGGADFSKPADQKKVAWQIAADTYLKNTNGRDLLTDLKSGNEDAITGAFVNVNNRWASLPGGKQPRTSTNDLVRGYQNDLANYDVSSYTPPQSVATETPRAISNGTGFAGRLLDNSTPIPEPTTAIGLGTGFAGGVTHKDKSNPLLGGLGVSGGVSQGTKIPEENPMTQGGGGTGNQDPWSGTHDAGGTFGGNSKESHGGGNTSYVVPEGNMMGQGNNNSFAPKPTYTPSQTKEEHTNSNRSFAKRPFNDGNKE